MLSSIHKSVSPFLPRILQPRPGINHDYFLPSPSPNDGYPYNTASIGVPDYEEARVQINLGRFSGADVYYRNRNSGYSSGSGRSSVDTSGSDRAVGDEGLKEFSDGVNEIREGNEKGSEKRGSISSVV
ncbi:hypothetical protein TWF694_009318 [Orbilia ellipsospora]|uniref:Uncharacterized protein n=1 Tax=Orbilia ellipsospora TaxID=2528407 RepID=A0AAV9XEL5_9PEZI